MAVTWILTVQQQYATHGQLDDAQAMMHKQMLLF
jgi:hypothetical protein